MDNLLIVIMIIVLVVLCFIITSRNEGLHCKDYRPGDKSHCPRACSRYLYPDMYSAPPCSDPFSWGFTYSTGRCPKAYGGVPPPPATVRGFASQVSPQPRRLPSPPKESFGDFVSHGGGASYDDPKHTTSTSYGYNYS